MFPFNSSVVAMQQVLGPSGEITIVAIAEASEALATAIKSVDEAVELIELCGYIPLIYRVKIAGAIGN